MFKKLIFVPIPAKIIFKYNLYFSSDKNKAAKILEAFKSKVDIQSKVKIEKPEKSGKFPKKDSIDEEKRKSFESLTLPKKTFNLQDSKPQPLPLLSKNVSKKEDKIITMRGSDSSLDKEETFNEIAIPLDMRSSINRKWEQFFKRQGRVIPDINRSINNFPNVVYFDFIFDYKSTFNDKQLLFAIKNIFLHKNPYIFSKTYELLKEIYVKFYHRKDFDLTNKSSILMLMEVLHLYHFDTIDPKEKEINVRGKLIDILEKVIDPLRLFSSAMTDQELVFIMKVLFDRNYLDAYLMDRLIKRIMGSDFETKMSYKILYFQVEVDLKISVLKFFDKYIKFCKTSFQNNENTIKYQEMKNIIEKHLINVM
jgi:hypothetical protein